MNKSYFAMIDRHKIHEEASRSLKEAMQNYPGSLPYGGMERMHFYNGVYCRLLVDRLNEIRAEKGLSSITPTHTPPRHGGLDDPTPVMDLETGLDYPSRSNVGNSLGPGYGIPSGRFAWTKLDRKFPGRFVSIPYYSYYGE